MRSVRTQHNFWVFVLYPMVGFTILVLGMYTHWAIALLIFPWSLLVEYRTRKMLCPRCSYPVGRRETRVYRRMNIRWWSPLVPRKCVHCGNPLVS